MFHASLASANLPITVLKFGGSVLSGPEALALVVSEVERTLESRSRTIVVTSAFSGVTERLLDKAASQFHRLDERALAGLLATGEARSAAFVALALEDANIPAELVDPDRIGLVVLGPSLDGEPVGVDVARVHKALSHAPVIVLPGFYGKRRDGSTALLGRGGSDLTALFLAEQVNAHACRLVKDVDGLFSHDPASGAMALHRYDSASWDELAAIGGGLVQAKAIAFARSHDVSFTIAAPLSQRGTRVAP